MDAQADNVVLITGGGGFVGSELGIALLKSNIKIKELVLCDVNEPRPLYGYENDERVVRIKSDLTNPKEADMLFEERTYSAIALLHGLMSGGSEANFDLGMAINLDATRYMLDKIRSIKHAKAPVVLYTSSGAVYGGEVADNTVTDATLPCPQGSYGAQKLICEHLCYDYSRRGWIDARIVRLPAIVVRPGAPNTALSSYASNIVREPLNGRKTVCPVSLDFEMFVCSPAMIVANFVHLMSISGDKYPSYTRTTAMPGIAVSTKDILDALEQVGGKKAVELVTVEPDESVLKIVRTWPGKWITERAVQLGCKRDNSILDAVRQYKTVLDQGRG